MMLGNSKENPAHPTVLWAQRTNQLFVTIEVHDCEDAQVTMEADKVVFEARAGGTGVGMDKKWYRAELPLYGAIDAAASRYEIAPRLVYIELAKKDRDQAWWPRLLKQTTKPFWLKTDFAKWRDEEDGDADDDLPGHDDADPLAGLNFSAPGGPAGGLGDLGNLMGNLGGGDHHGADEDSDDSDMAVDDLPPTEHAAHQQEAKA